MADWINPDANLRWVVVDTENYQLIRIAESLRAAQLFQIVECSHVASRLASVPPDYQNFQPCRQQECRELFLNATGQDWPKSVGVSAARALAVLCQHVAPDRIDVNAAAATLRETFRNPETDSYNFVGKWVDDTGKRLIECSHDEIRGRRIDLTADQLQALVNKLTKL
nr:MAG TPA: hypothetical protein [Caudoviricetes sp.]